MRKNLRIGILFLLLTMISVPAGADSITFNGSNGNLAASAEFILTNNTLTISLSNTSSADVLVPADVLTGLFFHTNPAHALTPVSVSLNGSSLFYGSTSNSGNGWEYLSGINAQGENSGISAAGLGIFGQSNFSGTHLNLGGIDYGILSAADDPSTGNTGVTGKGPLFNNSLLFTLNAGSGFDLSDLGSQVVFQYGSSTTEPSFPGTPVSEPSVLLFLGAGLVGIVGLVRFLKIN